MGYRGPSTGEQGLWVGGSSGVGAGSMGGILTGEQPVGIAEQRLTAFDDYVVNGRGGTLLDVDEVLAEMAERLRSAPELPSNGLYVLLHRPADRVSGRKDEVQFHFARVTSVRDSIGDTDIWVDQGPDGTPEHYSGNHPAIVRFAILPEMSQDGDDQDQPGSARYGVAAGADAEAQVLEGISMSRGVLETVTGATRRIAGVSALAAAGFGVLGHSVPASAQTITEPGNGRVGPVAAATVGQARAVRLVPPPAGSSGTTKLGAEYREVTVTAQTPTYWDIESAEGLPHTDGTGGDYLADLPPNQGKPATDLRIGEQVAVPVSASEATTAASRAPAGFHAVTIEAGDTIAKYAARVASATGQPLGAVIAQMVRENASLLLQDGNGDVQQGILDLQPGQSLLVPDSARVALPAPILGQQGQTAPKSGDQQQTPPVAAIGEAHLAQMVDQEVTHEFMDQMSAAGREVHPGGSADAPVDVRDIVLYINPITHVIQYGRVTSVLTGEQERAVVVNGVTIPVADLRLISGQAPAGATSAPSQSSVLPTPGATTSPHWPSVPYIPGVSAPGSAGGSRTLPGSEQSPPTSRAAHRVPGDPGVITIPGLPGPGEGSPSASAHPVPSPSQGAHPTPHDSHRPGAGGFIAIPGLPGEGPGFDLAPSGPPTDPHAHGSAVHAPVYEAAAPSPAEIHQDRQGIASRAALYARDGAAYHSMWRQIANTQETGGVRYSGQAWFEKLNGVSCDILVASAAHQLDSSFPLIDVGVQYNHMESSPLWEVVHVTSPDQLHAGDVLNWGDGDTSGGGAGHTGIALGNGEMVAASLGGHLPTVEPAYLSDPAGRGLTVFRYVGVHHAQSQSQPRRGAPVVQSEQGKPTVENFSTGFLKMLAQHLGVPESDVLTPEHELGIEAWFDLEKGNLDPNNFGWYNLANTGIDDPSLVVGGTNASGLQAFRSETDGQLALVESVMGSNQNRIAHVLKDPNSTAEDVLHAIAFYDETPGDKAWAWGYHPNDPAAVLDFNHGQYITTMLEKLHELRQRGAEARFGSTIIGPGQHGYNHVSGQSAETQFASTRSPGDHHSPRQQAPANGGAPSFGAPGGSVSNIPGLGLGSDDGQHGHRTAIVHARRGQAAIPGIGSEAPSPAPGPGSGSGNGSGGFSTANIPGA